MKKITLILMAFIASTCMWQINAQTYSGTTGPVPTTGTSGNAQFTVNVTETGTIGTDYEIDNLTITNMTHTFDGDLDISLIAPSGEIMLLAGGNGGSGDNYIGTVFNNNANPCVESGVAPFTGTWEPEGGLTTNAEGDCTTNYEFATVFNGATVNGVWILNIEDNFGGDSGFMNAWELTFNSLGPAPITECGNAPLPIPASGTVGDMDPSIATVTTGAGTIGTNYTIASVEINLTHTFDADLDIYLVSPNGLTLELSTDNGGAGDNYTNTVFADGFPSITTGSPPFTGTFEPEGGPMNPFFAGEPVNGDWTLNITDDVGGDSGTLLSYCINFDPILVIGNPPVISCPADITASNAAGQCGAVVNFAGTAIDVEDGNISGDIISTPPSGSFFNVGTTTVTMEVTDSDGNTVSCDFDVTIEDNEDPVIACQDITVELDANGDYNLTPGEALASSSDNCGIASIEFEDPNAGDVTECGPNGLPIPATGTSGPMDPSPAVVTTVGTVGVDYAIDRVDLDLNHTFDGDLNISLTSPNGLVLDLSSGNGGSGDNYTNTVFMDGFPSITTGTAPFTGTFQPEGGPMNVFFDGEPVDGNWTLNILDNFGGDSGVLNNYCITFASLAPPTVPSIDLTCANVGTNTFTVVVTDVNGNTSTCETEVTVEDNIAPVLQCIGAPGGVTITEDFEGASIPAGWSTIIVSGGWDWTFGSGVMPGGPAFASNAAIFDDDAAGSGELNNEVQLLSPVVDLSTSATADLSFDYSMQAFVDSGTLSVDVWDGSAWQQILFVDVDTAPTNSGVIDMTPFMNAAFQVRFTYDDENDWAWGAGVDNFVLNYDIPSSPYDAILDGTTGTVTVNASDLLLNVDEACGYTVSFGAGGSPINECGDGLPAAIDENLPPTESTSTVAESGILGTDYAIDTVTLDITHTFDGDLDIELISPAGTVLMLSDQNGGGGDNYTGTVFQDGGADITLGTPPFTGTFEPQGGTFAATFDGEDVNGGWVLRVTDNFGGDVGTLDSYCINFVPLATSTIEFDCSQLGLNQVDVTVTDDSGNSSTCTATVNVIDNTDPILVCMDATVELDENGMAEVTPDLFIDTTNSFDACGITITAVDVTDVTCDDIGTAITVTVFASDASGNLASCTATLTVVDNLGPTLVGCPEDQTVDPGPLNLFYELPDYWALGGITFSDNCSEEGDITNFGQSPAAGTLLPDGTYTITLFAEDEYGNVGECTFILTIESILGKDDIALDNAIAMYPNPTDGQVTISNTSNIQLERAVIYDANGRLVQEVDLRGMATERTFNVSSLASGVYMVQIQSESAQTVKRLIRR